MRHIIGTVILSCFVSTAALAQRATNAEPMSGNSDPATSDTMNSDQASKPQMRTSERKMKRTKGTRAMSAHNNVASSKVDRMERETTARLNREQSERARNSMSGISGGAMMSPNGSMPSGGSATMGMPSATSDRPNTMDSQRASPSMPQDGSMSPGDGSSSMPMPPGPREPMTPMSDQPRP